MARQVARQFCRLGEVHSLVYGRRASGENGRKLAASTRHSSLVVGSKSRLMDYLSLILYLKMSFVELRQSFRKTSGGWGRGHSPSVPYALAPPRLHASTPPRLPIGLGSPYLPTASPYLL